MVWPLHPFPDEPVNGGEVTFIVNTATGGAGASLTSTTATISGGQANVTPTANWAAGSYTVSSSTSGAAASVSFSLTNSPATPTMTALNVSTTYTGSPQGYPSADVTVSGAGGLTSSGGTLSYTYNGSSTVPTTAGSYTVLVTFTPTDSTDYTTQTATATFTIAALSTPEPNGFISASSGYDMPTFIWNPVAGANNYYLYGVDDTTGAVVINIANVAGTTFALTAAETLTPGHQYTWYLGAVSSSGAVSFNSGETITLAPLAGPKLVAPSGTIPAGSGYDMPAFSWNAVTGAGHYYLYVVDDSTGSVVINNPSINATTFSLGSAQALTAGHEFTWYVFAMSTNNQAYGYQAGGQTFSIAALPAPQLIGPTGTISASSGYETPTFSWGTSAGANHYYLLVVDSTTGAVAVNDPDVSGTSFTPSTVQALTPGHSFTWYVLAMSTNDQAYDYVTSGQTFTLAGLTAPSLIVPTGTVPASTSYDTPTFSWSTVAGADHYYLYVVDNNTNSVVLNIPDLSGTTFTVNTAQALTPGHSFTWHVYAMSANDQDFAGLPVGQIFTLSPLAAPTPSGPTGSVAAASGFDMPTFTWSRGPWSRPLLPLRHRHQPGQCSRPQRPRRQRYDIHARHFAGLDARSQLHLDRLRHEHQQPGFHWVRGSDFQSCAPGSADAERPHRQHH